MITHPSTTTRRPARRVPPDTTVNAWLLWSTEPSHERAVLSIAELAECRCPDLCNRDHANE